MPKINYFRGESRAFVRQRDPGTWGRKRNRLWGVRRHRTHRGQKGLLRDYRALWWEAGIRNWCPCCQEAVWRRTVRGATSRRENKRLVHRSLRAYGKRLCRQGLAAALHGHVAGPG